MRSLCRTLSLGVFGLATLIAASGCDGQDVQSATRSSIASLVTSLFSSAVYDVLGK